MNILIASKDEALSIRLAGLLQKCAESRQTASVIEVVKSPEDCAVRCLANSKPGKFSIQLIVIDERMFQEEQKKLVDLVAGLAVSYPTPGIIMIADEAAEHIPTLPVRFSDGHVAEVVDMLIPHAA